MVATSCGFESHHRHQTNIIRTKSSQWEMGSDYLFSLVSTRKPISETVLPKKKKQIQEDTVTDNVFSSIPQLRLNIKNPQQQRGYPYFFKRGLTNAKKRSIMDES